MFRTKKIKVWLSLAWVAIVLAAYFKYFILWKLAGLGVGAR